jgi:hypothetical protein
MKSDITGLCVEQILRERRGYSQQIATQKKKKKKKKWKL